MGVDMSPRPADGVPTITETVDADALRSRESGGLTAAEIAEYREWRRAQAQPVAASPPPPPQAAGHGFSPKQIIAAAAAFSTLLGGLGFGASTGVSSLTDAEVEQRTALHRKVMDESNAKLMEEVKELAKADRDEAKAKYREVKDELKGIRSEIKGINDSLSQMKGYNQAIKDGAGR